MGLGGFAQDTFFAVQPDTPAKLTGLAFAHKYLEVGTYVQLKPGGEDKRLRDGADAGTIADEERAMGARLAECWDDVMDASLEAQGTADPIS